MYKEIAEKFKEQEAEAIAAMYDMKRDKAKQSKPPRGETPDFAKAIRQLRTESGLSLEKLSETTGINKQTLHSIENRSIKNPSFANLEKIATALDKSLEDLVLLARAEFEGNLFKTSAAQRWTVSFETEKGFSIHSFSPPSASRRDFFVGVMTIKGGRKLRYWKFPVHSKMCIQPWDGDLQFTYHGTHWRKEVHVIANETLYFDGEIPHSFKNLSEKDNRVLLVTYPFLF